ncbi:MAG: DUF72 domain-containing protein [Mesosutterella sp.]|nr:DUF72 domain-containing protein [Mesosutterella sp.]
MAGFDLFEEEQDAVPIAPEPPSESMRRAARIIPRSVHLGSSSWAFPGWKGIVWSRFSSTRNLAQEGLRAYSANPILTTAGVDRAYYRPLPMLQYARFAGQVPDNFRFLVKAPAAVTDCMKRGAGGRPLGANPFYLNDRKAAEEFVLPVLEGLGGKAGPLVFEFSALPRGWLRDPQDRVRQIERLGEFLSRLPPISERSPDAFYAVEIRTPAIYTPRFLNVLRESGARLVIGLHPSMPDIARQTNALFALDRVGESGTPAGLKGPLVVRWSLALGDRFDDARQRFEPFSSIQRPDPVTREGIVSLILSALRGRQNSFVVANNKAEGCAPLSMFSLAERLAERISEERDRQGGAAG